MMIPADLAVCHCGAGSEARSGVCYVKFGVVMSDSRILKKISRIC
jgi:hypothetical protein